MTLGQMVRHQAEVGPQGHHELTKAKALLTADDLEEWQQQTEDFLFSNPDLREAMSDPDRI